MYKVIYPSELHGKAGDGQTPRQITVPKTLVTLTGAAAGRRMYKRRREDEEDEEKLDVPELSKEEKEEKKKHRPRTRSGRYGIIL